MAAKQDIKKAFISAYQGNKELAEKLDELKADKRAMGIPFYRELRELVEGVELEVHPAEFVLDIYTNESEYREVFKLLEIIEAL